MTQHPMHNGGGIRRIVKAGKCSLQGLLAAWRYETAFRQELTLVVFFLPLGLWLGQSGPERALLVGALFLVLIVELLNSAVEAVVDRVGEEIHELAGRAKDMGSAAVFLSLWNVFVIYVLIAFDRFT